jgi:hypothetical protein
MLAGIPLRRKAENNHQYVSRVNAAAQEYAYNVWSWLWLLVLLVADNDICQQDAESEESEFEARILMKENRVS